MKTELKKEYQWILKEKYNGKESLLFFRDIERLNAGEPLDYIIGTTSFLSSKIDLSNHPFIPRPETEFWVEKAIAEINSKGHVDDIVCLDIFSGSGCIGISLLKHIQLSKVTFAEKDKNYLQQIEKNIALNDIDPERTNVVQTDLFKSLNESSHSGLTQLDAVRGIRGKWSKLYRTYCDRHLAKCDKEMRRLRKSFDYIFANPPYISKNRPNTVEKSVIDYEPHRALFSDDDGLFYVKTLLKEAHTYLLPEGKLFIEFDPWQKKLIEEYLHGTSQQYSKVEFWNDIYNRPRVITTTK